ncbi:MAG: hypothetical protein KAG94_04610, partial [Clostridiales bacterium]|nr:hypothetical protein [Clostridiales bacterium]
FRNHGRKAICYEKFIESVSKNADILLTEGSMLGRLDEKLSTESDLEDEIVEKIKVYKGITLFQCSSQNIDRLVTFYRAAIKTNRIFIIDIYTAHILSGLKELGNNLPHPSDDYKNIKVFYPTGIKRRIYKMLGYEYLEKFFKFSANLKFIQYKQKEIVMIVRPSMMSDFQEVSELKNSLFIYSLWSGYREQASQVRFEEFLKNKGAESVHIHTSGHAVLSTLKDLIAKIEPKRIIPIHTFFPEMFLEYSDKVTLAEDGKEIVI